MNVVAPKRMLLNDSVVCAEIDGEAVLLDVESGVYFGLDRVGTDIWKLMSSGLSEDEVFTQLQSEYDVHPEQLRSDLDTFLDSLVTRGLVTTEQP